MFKFTHTYFNKTVVDDEKSGVRVEVKETPTLDITEEDYSLRIETRHSDIETIHRKYAIEQHLHQKKHNFPHLQFKFYTEEIGTFWIRLNFKTAEEYKHAILGFIYKMKDVVEELEVHKKGITSEIFVVDLVDSLSADGDFLVSKIAESIATAQIEFEHEEFKRVVPKITSHSLLLDFLGKKNMTDLAQLYSGKKKK